ncbi:MAG: ATP-binding protein [Hylemonella sp.]|uniref:ATP-binding response regulator n=1 Tax=Hylemonella sp. TaxID=2066020 RepID=UPI00391BC9D2
MRFLDIRARMLLAALLPVTLVAVLLSSVFLAGRYADLDEGHQQRARSLVRQLASASEYGLFSANTGSLQSIAAGALRESDVRSVLILDAQGQTLAVAGWTGQVVLPALGTQEQHWVDAKTGHDLLVQPVSPSQLQLDDLFEGQARADAADAPPLGHVVMEVSRAGVVSRSQDMLAIGVAVTLGGLLFGSVLAVRIGRGVIQPILRVSRMIARIGAGELGVRGEVRSDDPLRDLQQGLNQMAEHLQQGRDELERRVTLATAELRTKKDEAETATRAKSRFLAAASHDLRQPIHALGMFVARLAQLPHDRETRHLIGNLEASVRAMQDLLDALLDISRLDADAVRVQLQPVPLAPLFDQLRGALMPVATDKGLRLRVRDSNLWVQSDPTLLHRILLNLVSNALRYTGHGGVLVGCRRSRGGSHVWIEVWDTGVGIPAEHQQDIFREFYQIGNPERDRSKGLGLGLNIVDRTARLLGHELKLCSVPGHGTRFRLELPLSPAGDLQALMAAAEQPQQVDDVRGLRILVIEDERQSAQALRGLLDSWGCVVAVVEGLQGALTVVKGGFVPDLVLSDFRLRAGESGMQTLHSLRTQLERPLPACLMSGDTDPELIQSCRDAGLPLLHKPVRPAKLRTLIRRLARPQSAQD